MQLAPSAPTIQDSRSRNAPIEIGGCQSASFGRLRYFSVAIATEDPGNQHPVVSGLY